MAMLAIASIAVGACSSAGSQGGGAGAKGGTLTVINETGGLWTCGFSQFSTATNLTSVGIVYEPLYLVNSLSGKQTPWLATSYRWSPDGKVLTFTIRDNVKWSDGQPFGASDVLYTFNLLKQNSALDMQSAWAVLADVKQQGANEIVMTFKSPAIPFFYFIAGQIGMVAEHVWSKVPDPVTYEDKQPVGTGPFTVGQCTPQNITYVRNPNYWQAGKPTIDKVQYPAFTSNETANAYLENGKGDWGGQFIPNIQSAFVSKDPGNHHYWFPPTGSVDLFLNQTVAPLKDKVVRQALAYSIDRARVARIGEYGYPPAGDQSNIARPTFDTWYNAKLAARYDYKFNVQKAQSLLAQAGYKKGAGGALQGADGKPLTLDVISNGTYPDWVSDMQVVQDNMRQVGIDLKVENLAQNDWQNRLFTGDFQMAYYGPIAGPNPYYELRNVLYGPNSAPIGQTAASNYERWQDPATDQLFDAFGAAAGVDQQHQILDQIQQVMLEDVPVIPVTEAVSLYQWNSARFTGWPTKDDAYVNPPPWMFPEWEVVLLNLRKK